MGLSIENRQFLSEQHVAANTFLLSNVSKLITETFEIHSNFDFTSSVNQQIMFNAPDSLKLLSGDWGGLGFVVGDTVALTGVAQNASGTTLTFSGTTRVISNIIGDTMYFSVDLYTTTSATDDFAGVIMPIQGQSQSLQIVNNTRSTPETIEIYHNTVLNTSTHSDSSLIDGEVNRFRVDGVDGLSVSGSANFTQLGDKSGGRYVGTQTITRLADSGGNKVFEVQFQYFLPSYSDADLLEPTWYENAECLKPTFKVVGFPQLNNPNSEITVISGELEANTGFFNESYNQGVNDFTISSVTITDSSGTALTELDPNQTCTVEAVITGSADFNDFIECMFEVIPPTDDYKNNALSNLNNSFVSYFSKDGASAASTHVYAKNSAQVTTSNHSITTATNQITVSFDVEPNTEFADYINALPQSERLYRLSLAVESTAGTTNNNNSVTLILNEGELTAAPIPDAPFDGVRSSEFLNHAQSIATGLGEVDYNGRTEDDFIYKALLNMPENEVYEQMTIQVEVVRDSDGTSFDLYSNTLGFDNVPVISGVQQFNQTLSVNQLLDGTGRNVISFINTGVTGTGTYEAELIVSLMANWRDWISNNQAFVDFYNASLPQNGQSQEWVRYTELAGFSIRLRCRLIKSGVAYYFGGGINLDDYDNNFNGTTTITYFDENNTQVTALIAGQVMTIRADHVLNVGSWDALDTWGWIAQRGFETDPRKQISTAWDWTSQNAPLKPKTGETRATLDIVTTNTADDTARVECLLDLTNGAIEENSIVARIESPSAPDCVSPIDYIIDMAAANADTETDIPSIISNYLTNGLKANNICCPDCTVRLISTGEDVELYAFGTKTDIDALIADIDGDVNPICCQDEYGALAGCEVAFDTEWDNLMLEVTGNTAALTALTPAQINTYTDTDLAALSSKIQAITTDEVIRYDIINTILTNGLKVICNGGVKTISAI